MSRRGENIYKRKDGRWEGRYIKGRSTGGKAQYGYVYAKSYQDVKTRLQRVAGRAMDCEAPINLESQKPKEAVEFLELAKDWLQSQSAAVKESSWNRYQNTISNYLVPAFGSVQVEHLTQEQLESAFDNLLLHGGVKGQGLSGKTVADTLSVMRRILRFGIKKGYSLQCDANEIQISQKTKPMRVFSRREQNILVAFLMENLDIYAIGILVSLFTGIRVGELCALRWDDISCAEQTIYIHRTMQRIQTKQHPGRKTRIVVSSPKSECSNRMIPIPSHLLHIIMTRGHEGNVSGYFLSTPTKPYIEPRTMQNHFKRILEKCGIAPANYHALRHTFATRCVELGFDIKSLSEILGHANVNITMNRYVHPSMELKQRNMQKLSSLIAVI